MLIASLLEFLEKTSRLVPDVFLVCTDSVSQLKIKSNMDFKCNRTWERREDRTKRRRRGRELGCRPSPYLTS